MPILDHHRKPYDEGTLAKLDVFQMTAEGFLGVFLRSGGGGSRVIRIHDYFCGPGVHKGEKEGCCVRLLRELRKSHAETGASACTIDVLLNDADPNKVDALEENLKRLGLDTGPYAIRYSRREFQDVLADELIQMRRFPGANLIFVDQNGYKEFSQDVFQSLRAIPRTDVMVFLAASNVLRFRHRPDTQKYVETDKAFGTETEWNEAMRSLVAWYQTLVPVGCEYYLAPFSIRKSSGVFGVMFCTSNLKGLEKFLEAAWKKDPQNGEASWDIEGDGRFSLEGELQLGWGNGSKVSRFHVELEALILSKGITTNADVYRLALVRRCLPKHANELLKSLHAQGKIEPVRGVNYRALADPKPIVLR